MSKKEIARWGVAVVFTIILASILSKPISNWAFSKSIQPWDKEVAIYYNNSDYDRTLRFALNRWEATGVIRFQETDSPDSADLVIHDTLENESDRCGECDGMVDHRGYSLFDKTTDLYLFPPTGKDDRFVDASEANIIIHELGHFLGLPHSRTRKCSIMTAYVSECTRDSVFLKDRHTFSCGPYGYDIKNLEALYGFESKRLPPCFEMVDRKEYLDAERESIQESLLEYFEARSFLDYLREDYAWDKSWLYEVDKKEVLEAIRKEVRVRQIRFPDYYSLKAAFRDVRKNVVEDYPK